MRLAAVERLSQLHCRAGLMLSSALRLFKSRNQPRANDIHSS